jgi:hypothetical protein
MLTTVLISINTQLLHAAAAAVAVDVRHVEVRLPAYNLISDTSIITGGRGLPADRMLMYTIDIRPITARPRRDPRSVWAHHYRHVEGSSSLQSFS